MVRGNGQTASCRARPGTPAPDHPASHGGALFGVRRAVGGSGAGAPAQASQRPRQRRRPADRRTDRIPSDSLNHYLATARRSGSKTQRNDPPYFVIDQTRPQCRRGHGASGRAVILLGGFGVVDQPQELLGGLIHHHSGLTISTMPIWLQSARFSRQRKLVAKLICSFSASNRPPSRNSTAPAKSHSNRAPGHARRTHPRRGLRLPAFFTPTGVARTRRGKESANSMAGPMS